VGVVQRKGRRGKLLHRGREGAGADSAKAAISGWHLVRASAFTISMILFSSCGGEVQMFLRLALAATGRES